MKLTYKPSKTRSSLPVVSCGGCSGCSLLLVVFNLLLGGIACRYCLLHWLPILHASYPMTFNMPDPNMSLWPGPIILGLFGAELFVPGAIITWILIAMNIVH